MFEQKCILNEKRSGGCGSCSPHCPHRIALNGLTGVGGRVGASGMPKDYLATSLTNSPVNDSQGSIYASLGRYIQTFSDDDVKSVYLWSESPGTGKTTTACALLNEWISRKYVEYWRAGKQVPQILGMFLDINEMQSEYNLATMANEDSEMKRFKDKIVRAQQAPYLVIDDIGVRGATEAFRAYVHSIVNHRVSNGMPTVYTSNLSIEDMEDVFDERLYDRIRSNTGVMEFSGGSKRKHVGR